MVADPAGSPVLVDQARQLGGGEPGGLGEETPQQPFSARFRPW